MNSSQNGKERNLENTIPGCLGRMVNLFDLNVGMGGNKLLTEKPHHDGVPLSRSQSDAPRTSLVDDQTNNKVIVPELRKSPSNMKSNGTPIKTLIAQEMSKEEDYKQSPPNLVAKLMGLDALPQHHHLASAHRSHLKVSRSRSGPLDFLHQERQFLDTQAQNEINQYPEQRYKDVYEIWQKSNKINYDSPQKGTYRESKNDKKMALVREKFMEAKRLSTDERLRHSKQFHDALDVLSSNKDLFVKFLQEPNSLVSQHLNNLPYVPLPPDSRRITVLRPSKLVNNHMATGSGKKNEKQVNGIAQMGHFNMWDKSSSEFNQFMQSPECCKIDDNPTQPTRIVVLKPSSGKTNDIKFVSSSLKTSNEDIEALESREVAKDVTGSMCETLSGHRRDEALLSSVLSNGYIGDESSFNKSEIDFLSEVISPTSRHSWDYINQFDSPYSTSFSRASFSPESSVCREAKKRLSERWAMIASNGCVQEQRHVRRSSSTLGEMLALSDLKNPITSEKDSNNQEDVYSSPTNLQRSKSVPVSSTESRSTLSVKVADSLNGDTTDTKNVKKEKSAKSSLFKGKFSSLFSSRNKKSSKEKPHQFNDEPQSGGLLLHSSRNIGDDGSQCIKDTAEEEESCIGLHRSSRKASCQDPSDARLQAGVILPEGRFSVSKPGTSGNPEENLDQPSPISVLEPQFEDDAHTADYDRNAKLNEHGAGLLKYNLIDKSPPIGSIARTLSWDDSAVGPATLYPGKISKTPLNWEEEEQECLIYIQALLSASGLDDNMCSNSVLARWHSPESPLDPTLKDKYMNLNDAAKQRHQRSIRKLVFDLVNETLIDIRDHGPAPGSMVDRVWVRVKDWISGEESGGDGDDSGSLVVERVVQKEAVGGGWPENLRMEVNNVRREIEGKLLEELVQEYVLELTG